MRSGNEAAPGRERLDRLASGSAPRRVAVAFAWREDRRRLVPRGPVDEQRLGLPELRVRGEVDVRVGRRPSPRPAARPRDRTGPRPGRPPPPPWRSTAGPARGRRTAATRRSAAGPRQLGVGPMDRHRQARSSRAARPRSAASASTRTAVATRKPGRARSSVWTRMGRTSSTTRRPAGCPRSRPPGSSAVDRERPVELRLHPWPQHPRRLLQGLPGRIELAALCVRSAPAGLATSWLLPRAIGSMTIAMRSASSQRPSGTSSSATFISMKVPYVAPMPSSRMRLRTLGGDLRRLSRRPPSPGTSAGWRTPGRCRRGRRPPRRSRLPPGSADPASSTSPMKAMSAPMCAGRGPPAAGTPRPGPARAPLADRVRLGVACRRASGSARSRPGPGRGRPTAAPPAPARRPGVRLQRAVDLADRP